MKIGIIFNIKEDEYLGLIGVNKIGDIAYISENNDLNYVLEILTNKEYLELTIQEKKDNVLLNRTIKIHPESKSYFSAINDMLPNQFKILFIKEIDSDLEQLVDLYKTIGGNYEEITSQ